MYVEVFSPIIYLLIRIPVVPTHHGQHGMLRTSQVVGHSNTVPGLVEYLGGTPGGPIDEKMEYDRLYVVHTGSGRPASTTLLRY